MEKGRFISIKIRGILTNNLLLLYHLFGILVVASVVIGMLFSCSISAANSWERKKRISASHRDILPYAERWSGDDFVCDDIDYPATDLEKAGELEDRTMENNAYMFARKRNRS